MGISTEAREGVMETSAENTFRHEPVMLTEVLRLLAPQPGETIVDGTLGYGGHSLAILRELQGKGLLLGVDRDPEMAARAGERLSDSGAQNFRIVVSNYSRLDEVLSASGDRADGILLDLGVASPQIEDPRRGFSYRVDGPLDMRMTPDQDFGAAEWINSAEEKDIADVLFEYGEERFSRRIARAILRARDRAPIRTTGELAEIIRRASPPGPRRLHPARRSFQALRILVNRELEHLDRFLEILPGLLKPNGRCVVMSYHSLEDRRVKNVFRQGIRDGLFESLTRKPLRPSEQEVDSNPRSRSARVRAVRRLAEGAAQDRAKGRNKYRKDRVETLAAQGGNA